MWTAVTLWALSIGGVALYAAWAVPALARGLPAWMVVVGVLAIYFALVATFMATYFAIAWIRRSERPPAVRIGVRAMLRLVWREYRALAGAAKRMMFYRLVIKSPARAPAALPVLLVHGVLCNAGVWEGFARYLRKRNAGPVYTISYGPPLASIETFADQLARRIDTVLAATGARQLLIVSHSMGGLVTLAYCRKYGAAKIRRAIALAAPYRGSVHAWMMFGACLAQLRPGNVWLDALHAGDYARPPITSIWSWHDSMVAPQLSSRLPGADNVELVGVGHNAILADADARAHALAAITAEQARAVTSESPA
ncbi:MAG: alpha/beta fold hydrolase [Betaproteobacteria bacterium]